MKRDFGEALRETLDRELAGLTVTPSRQRAVYEFCHGLSHDNREEELCRIDFTVNAISI